MTDLKSTSVEEKSLPLQNTEQEVKSLVCEWNECSVYSVF